MGWVYRVAGGHSGGVTRDCVWVTLSYKALQKGDWGVGGAGDFRQEGKRKAMGTGARPPQGGVREGVGGSLTAGCARRPESTGASPQEKTVVSEVWCLLGL